MRRYSNFCFGKLAIFERWNCVGEAFEFDSTGNRFIDFETDDVSDENDGKCAYVPECSTETWIKEDVFARRFDSGGEFDVGVFFFA